MVNRSGEDQARARDFNFRDKGCADEMHRHLEFKNEMEDMVRTVLADAESFEPVYEGLRVIRHPNPRLVFVFTVHPADGSITFEAFMGPNSRL